MFPKGVLRFLVLTLLFDFTQTPSVYAQSINYDSETNTAFMTIDEPYGGIADLALRFGGELGEYLKFNRAKTRFEFSNSVSVQGNLAAKNGLYGATLSLSGSTTTLNTVTYTWPDAPAAFSGQVLQVNPATGLLSWGIPVTFITKPSDESVISSSALQDDDDFHVIVGPNETWIFQFWVSSSTSTTADYKFALKGAAGSTCEFVMGSIEQAAVNRSGNCTNVPSSFTIAGPSTPDVLSGFATYTQGSTTSDVVLQWAQNTANGIATMFRSGSFMLARRIR